MTKAAKLTKTQTANLNRIWRHRTAAGLVSRNVQGAGRDLHTAIDGKTCVATGFDKMHANAAYSLVSKGLARTLVTKVSITNGYGTFFVKVLVLTDAGRAAIGV